MDLNDDLDRIVIASRQLDLFQTDPEPEPYAEAAARSERPDPEKIRLELMALLETARGAKTMPWPERDARMWQVTFLQLTNWLPADEAAQLRLAFAEEIQRLRRAALASSSGTLTSRMAAPKLERMMYKMKESEIFS